MGDFYEDQHADHIIRGEAARKVAEKGNVGNGVPDNKYQCMMCEFNRPHRWHDNGEYNYDQEDTHVSAPIQGDDPTSDYPTPKEMAEQAIDLVYSDRQKDYGHPADDYGRTAALWSALLGVKITAKQAALCMVLVKLSREMNRPKPDNMIDAHGYLLVAGRIKEREMGRE